MSRLREPPEVDEPAFRGSQLLAKMKAIANTEPAFSEPVRERLGPAFLQMSEEISGAQWLPLDADVQLNHALFDTHGNAGVRRIAVDSIAASLSGTLLGPIAQGGLRLFGTRPSRLFGLVPRTMSMVFRNCGNASVENSTASDLNLTFSDLPSGFFMPGYSEALASAFIPVLNLCPVEGGVSVAERDEKAGRIVVSVRWTDT